MRYGENPVEALCNRIQRHVEIGPKISAVLNL